MFECVRGGLDGHCTHVIVGMVRWPREVVRAWMAEAYTHTDSSRSMDESRAMLGEWAQVW